MKQQRATTKLPRPGSRAGVALVLLLIFFNVQADTANIAVASNFLMPARALASQFETLTGHRIIISAGSTGKLYAQITHGAPYDILFAANSREPERLVNEGKAISESLFTYARGQLILWSADPERFSSYDRVPDLTKLKIVAIANPRTAPYGEAAVSVLERYVGKSRKLRLIRGESVSQSYQYAASGNAQAGFIALSQVIGNVSNRGSYWKVPPFDYKPINQKAVLLKRGQHNIAATAFLEFIRSTEVQAVIVRNYGYVPVGIALNSRGK